MEIGGKRELGSALGETGLNTIKPEHGITSEKASEIWNGAAKEYESKTLKQDAVDKVNSEICNLTAEEKLGIEKESGWPSDVVDNIRSYDEYNIYRDAGLQVVEIGDNTALIRNDIDWNMVDEKGKTNEERIERGLAPIGKDGNLIELHHIGQHQDSPLAELTFKEHRCDGNYSILHDRTMATEVHGEGNTWQQQRQDYWKSRAEYNNYI